MKQILKITKTFSSEKNISLEEGKTFNDFQTFQDMFSPEETSYIINYKNNPLIIPSAYAKIITKNE